jgi:hypothetical protein
MDLNVIGKWAFLIGLAIAVLAAVIGDVVSASTVLLVLFILGLLVGLLNVTEKDSSKFLIATIALLVLGVGSISTLSVLGVVSTYLDSILGNFIAFVGAAALVVSIKTVIQSTKQ